MSRPLPVFVAVVMLFVTGVGAVRPTRAAETRAAPSAAELLPASTLFYAELSRPGDVTAQWIDHPLVDRIANQSPELRRFFESPQYKEFQAVVALVERRANVTWRGALENVSGGGIVIAFDPATQGTALLVRSTNAVTTRSVLTALIDLAREDAKNKGKPDPVKQETHRGVATYVAGEMTITELGPWLSLCNKPRLSQSVIDSFSGDRDKSKSTLAIDEDFTSARAMLAAAVKKGSGPTGWAFARLAPLRAMAKAAGKPFADPAAKSENPAAELLFGGLSGTLAKSPFLAATLHATPGGWKLSVTSPHDPAWVPAERDFFFAPEDDAAVAKKAATSGETAPPLRPRGTLMSVSAYRNLGAMWAAGPDLFSEAVAAQLAQADSGLSTFLGGKSFGTDVLGALEPQLRFVVARQNYKAAEMPEPGIRLPAFATVFRLKVKEAADAQVRKHLRVAFQSVVALANLDGASKNRPMLEMRTEKLPGRTEIHFATYDREPARAIAGAEDEGAGPPRADAADMYYNFSPAMVATDDALILSSTKALAEELADLVAKESKAAARGKPVVIRENTVVELDAGASAELLRENREPLIAQNMLEKGHDRAAAEREIDLVLTIAEAFKGAALRLTPTENAMTLELDVRLK